MGQMTDRQPAGGKSPTGSSAVRSSNTRKSLGTATRAQAIDSIGIANAQASLGALTDLSPNSATRLQRTIGNRAVNRLIELHRLQAKLTVGAANDPYEREADQVASQVMAPGNAPAGHVMRKEEGLAQRKSDSRHKVIQPITPLVQRRVSGLAGSFEAGDDVERQLTSASGQGTPLPPKLRSELEPKFDADFSKVRVHTGAQSNQLNRQIGALAFTHANDIYMAEGQYNPISRSGKHLLAHELTHVVQQNGGINRHTIQRAVGFEFEVGTYEVRKLKTPITKPQKQGTQEIPMTQTDDPDVLPKGTVLKKGTDYELQVDEGANDRHLEFVTTGHGFPETSSGRSKLQTAMKDMVKTADLIRAKGQRAAPKINNNGLRMGAVTTGDISGKSTTPATIIMSLGGSMSAAPQATAGIRLDQIATMMETSLGTGPTGETGGQKTQRSPGRGYLASGSPTDAAIMGPAPGHARTAIQNFIATHTGTAAATPGGFGSNSLVSLLALLHVYLTIAAKPLQNYPKVIAPLLARTSFVGMYNQLPDTEKAYFAQDRTRFVQLALEAANMPSTEAQSVFTQGFTTVTGVNAGADTTKFNQRLQTLARGYWLEQIVAGNDALTKTGFTNIQLSEYLESMGSLGTRTESVGKKRKGGLNTKTQAPILEMRRMTKGLDQSDWVGFALDVFDYVKGVNDLKNPTFGTANMDAQRLARARKNK